MEKISVQVLSLFGGAQIILTGFVVLLGKLWLERKKAKLVTDLERVKSDLQSIGQQLQSALDKSLHVHKVQFDNEYRIYTDLWNKLISLRSAAVKLRRENLDNPPVKTQQQAQSDFIEAFNTYNAVVERNRPFHADAVYAAMKELRMIARTEWRQSNPDRPITEKVWDEVEVNRDKIVESVEKTCASIRERIESVCVI